MGRDSLKTTIKLKKEQAAIIFAPQGIQLVYPEGGEESSHVTLATSIVLALQYDAFLSYLAGFTRAIANDTVGKEATH